MQCDTPSSGALLFVLALVQGALTSLGAASSDQAAIDRPAPRRSSYAVMVRLTELPPRTANVPVTLRVDFDQLLSKLNARGTVDDRSIRMLAPGPEGARREEAVQFTPLPQPRLLNRPLLPGTVPGVSYLGEYRPGETPSELRVVGDLTWLAQADETGHAEYQLEFATMQTGRAIQVPYPPQNLRIFDEDGRATPVRWFPTMQIRPQWPLDGKLNLLDQHRLFSTYHLGPTENNGLGLAYRRPFLYPLHGPDGVSLTELGKPHDPTGSHAHHYSFWIAHAAVNSHDFWSEKGGLIAHERLESLEDGPIFCRVVQHTRWLAGDKAFVRDRREFKFYRSAPGFRLIDLELELAPAGAESVTFGKTSFGFLATRIAQSMSVFDGGGEILNARGQRNEQQAHLQRAEWIDQSGPVGPELWNGLAIFDHPSNPNHPTGWHCRNDGWVGAAFNLQQPYTLEVGTPLRLRYRVLLHRHNAAGGQVEERYRDYAAQPAVRIILAER